MSSFSIQEILSLVEKPSRYLGNETNVVCKPPEAVKLAMVLAFPDLYEIGTSHFGIQILYHLLNSREDICAERVFAPGADMEEQLRKSKEPLLSLESRRPLKTFDIVGFSLLYELNYTNMINMLALSHIPLLSAERDASYPVIIAGGPCACNPEPVAEIFDAILVGDGEYATLQMADTFLMWKEEKSKDKCELLQRWSKIEGVYIPSLFTVSFNEAGRQITRPNRSDYRVVSRAVVDDIEQAPFPSRPVVPYGKPVHDRLRLEISRGCTRGCRFCQAGMIYRPVRERSVKSLLQIADQSIYTTGYDDISLLSLSTGDYGSIETLLDQLMVRCQPRNIAVSLPSLRAGTLTPDLMKQIKRVRKTGFTIAPEAGTQRLRDVINKNISDADILDTVMAAYELGWQVIKLYFMIGLPTETEKDLDGIIKLVEKIRKAGAGKTKRGRLNVSISTFVPKPHTPFQWFPQISLQASKEKLAFLRSRLKKPGIHVKWQNPEVSFLEGVWSRGDRRLSRLLIRAYEKGCRFDGWSDKFRFDLWQEAMEELGVEGEQIVCDPQKAGSPLPWDHILIGVNHQYLVDEWQRAMNGDTIDDCREGICNACGVCDFKRVQPTLHAGREAHFVPELHEKKEQSALFTYELLYAKTGDSRFLGHLETAKLFSQAIRRSRIPIAFSRGFHPLPKISFDDPLPVGVESDCERVFISLQTPVNTQRILSDIAKQLKCGITVFACRLMPGKAKHEKETVLYRICTPRNMDAEKLVAFDNAPQYLIQKRSRKGRKMTIDLKKHIINVSMSSPTNFALTIKPDGGKTVRPSVFLSTVLEMTDEEIRLTRVFKTKETVF
jgi:radical SAM family uncharacterized protein/radical SAM-linked protein